jgi:hypothetical protein
VRASRLVLSGSGKVQVMGSFEHISEPTVSTKGGGFLGQLSDY